MLTLPGTKDFLLRSVLYFCWDFSLESGPQSPGESWEPVVAAAMMICQKNPPKREGRRATPKIGKQTRESVCLLFGCVGPGMRILDRRGQKQTHSLDPGFLSRNAALKKQ